MSRVISAGVRRGIRYTIVSDGVETEISLARDDGKKVTNGQAERFFEGCPYLPVERLLDHRSSIPPRAWLAIWRVEAVKQEAAE